jgi:hypothetical protein
MKATLKHLLGIAILLLYAAVLATLAFSGQVHFVMNH